MPFPVAALEIVRHALGPRAGRVLLGADTFGAEQALALGLVDEIADDLLPRALSLTAELAARSPEAYRMAKERLHRPAVEAIEAAAPDEHTAVLAGWTSAETRGRIEDALAALATRAR